MSANIKTEWLSEAELRLMTSDIHQLNGKKKSFSSSEQFVIAYGQLQCGRRATFIIEITLMVLLAVTERKTIKDKMFTINTSSFVA